MQLHEKLASCGATVTSADLPADHRLVDEDAGIVRQWLHSIDL
ncbi:hypothetical protein ACFSE1_08510 [Rhizobium helianthi]|uniref:Uncharacterized protein n=1 Tax=Rhizobium helianthi TaxID=1132695 RepID=A0ABW4M4X0_9HYPH